MTTPTPEQFLAQPADPEDDEETFPVVHVDTGDPLGRIACAVERLLEIVEKTAADEEQADHNQALIDQLDRELGEKAEKIDAALEALGKSTSKVSIAVRAILQGEPVAAADEPELPNGGPEQPGDDAPVEEWRGYARSRGYAGPDVDTANRSQIRTMLGIPQPTAATD